MCAVYQCSETNVLRGMEHNVPLNPSDPVTMSPDLVNKYNLCHTPSGNAHKSTSSPEYICVTMAIARATPPAVLVLVMQAAESCTVKNTHRHYS